MDRMQDMLDLFSDAPYEMLPSKYWIELNKKNIFQLNKYGYNNFKLTIALNYFTWLRPFLDEQIYSLIIKLPFVKVISIIGKTFYCKKHKFFSWPQSFYYNLITYMLWEYVSIYIDKDGYNLFEPIEGSAPEIYKEKRLISQDLANSIIEYNSIMNSDVKNERINTIMELGAGYGRTAFVFLKLIPKVRYIIVDIPPALYIAEKYLSNQFKDKKIFKFRHFDNYSEIKNEFTNSGIAFFLPNQITMLPDNIADLFINISSLHEMRKDQIEYYFKLIKRLTSKYFYLKQWRKSKIPFENIIIRESDYPIGKDWSIIYWNKCKIQIRFFEALLKVLK